jgi:hypothetical protein
VGPGDDRANLPRCAALQHLREAINGFRSPSQPQVEGNGATRKIPRSKGLPGIGM